MNLMRTVGRMLFYTWDVKHAPMYEIFLVTINKNVVLDMTHALSCMQKEN